jgi:DNA polymerase-1
MPRVREWQGLGFTLKPLLQIHDELLFEMDEEIVEVVVPQFSEIMVHAVELSVPVKVDAEIGPNWLDMVGFEKWREERGVR